MSPNTTINFELLKKYRVYYLGGHPQNTKKVQDTILNVRKDLFTIESKSKNFTNIEIKYDVIKKVELVERKISGVDVLAAGIASLAFKKPIVIHITYVAETGSENLIELEMADALTPFGNETRCKELMELLRANNVVNRFTKSDKNDTNISIPNSLETNPTTHKSVVDNSSSEIFSQIEKLSELHNAGILNSVEFEDKKKQLLSRL